MELKIAILYYYCYCFYFHPATSRLPVKIRYPVFTGQSACGHEILREKPMGDSA
jgi:hypothetical protein